MSLVLGDEEDFFHPLVEGFALMWCFVGESGDVAQEIGHVLVYTVWFPAFPAYLRVGIFGSVVEGEEIVLSDMRGQETVIWIVFAFFSLFFDVI